MRTCFEHIAYVALCLLSACRDDNATSDGELQGLVHCAASDTPLRVPFVPLESIVAIDPVGRLAPLAHVFPTPHTYWNITETLDIVAPADMRIVRIAAYTEGSSTLQYKLYASPCIEVQIYLDHVVDLAQPIAEAFAAAPDPGCLGTGCNRSVQVNLRAGDRIGTVRAPSFDVGAYDARVTPIAYANPARWRVDEDRNFDPSHITCPLSLFESDDALRATLTGKLGRVFDGAHATDCGTLARDAAASAQGYWFFPGSDPNLGESQQLALAPISYVDPDSSLPLYAFSVGASVSTLSPGAYEFAARDEGLVNRRFDQIGEGEVACYEGLRNLDGIVLLTLSNDRLALEHQAATACGSGPWTMTDARTTFER